MSDLNDAHRMLLQAMMSKRVCNQDEMKELCKLCCSNCNVPPPDGDNNFDNFVNKINPHIRPIHMELTKGICEESGKLHYALINLCETAVSRMAIDYTQTDLEFFKKIVEKIVTESDNGSVSSTNLLNLTDQLERRITKKNAQDLLEKFTEDDWLMQKKGSISLSIRSMLELDHYIREMYPEDVTVCDLCKKLVLKGQICPNDECPLKIHNHCASRFFKSGKTKTCRRCNTEWDTD